MNSSISLRVVAVLAIAAVATFAANPVPPKKAPGAPAQSDAAIETAIRARLAKSKMAAEHFTVHVQGGVATFEGKTDVIQHKGAATRIGHACGAQVANHIQISDAARAKAQQNLSKARGGSGGELKKSQVSLR